MCRDYNVELLGALPLDIRIREHTDAGKPSVVAEPDGQIADIYRTIARLVAAKISDMARDYSDVFTQIIMEDD